MAESNTLKEVVKEIAEKKDYKNATIDIQATTSGGGNFSSTLYLATVSAPLKDDLKLFAKILISSDDENTSNIFSQGFATETVFYTELALEFEKLYNKCDVAENDRLCIPKYFAHKSSKSEKVLVLENLVARGFENFDRFKSIDLEHASASIEQLAKFHALGLAYKKDKQETLSEMGKMFSVDPDFIDKVKNMLYEQVVKMGTQVIKDEYRSKMEAYLKENDLLDAVTKCWYSPEEIYLIHGDYRPNNLMHRKHVSHTL